MSVWIGPQRRWRLILNRKSLVSKDKKGKEALPRPPLSPDQVQATPPPATLSVSDLDIRVGSQLSKMSASFDRKLDALQALILSNFSFVQSHGNISVSARLSQSHSFSAPPEVPVLGPAHGPEASPHEPEKTVGFNRDFQACGVEWVPSSFWTPFPTVQGDCLARVGIKDSDAGQRSPDPPVTSVPHAEVRTRAQVHFSLPSDGSLSSRKQPEEEGDDNDSVASHPPVVDKMLVCLASFIHDRYPESRPLSSPVASWSVLNLLALSTPPESHHPPFRLSLPWLLWLRVLVRQAWGGGGGFVLHLGHPPGSLCSPIFTVRWVWAFLLDHIEFCSLYFASSCFSLLFRCAGMEYCGCPSLVLRLCQL